MKQDAAQVPATPLRGDGLQALLGSLRTEGYRFVTPTPATHRLVIGREAGRRARDLRDVFGWSLPFDDGLLTGPVMDALRLAGALEQTQDGLRAAVRVSTLEDALFLHSAFPPDAQDAVFFGPDTYRFARFLRAQAHGRDLGVAVDVGAGSGAGAFVVAGAFRPARLLATDVNPAALQLAGANLAVAGVHAELRLGDGLDAIDEPVDLIVANPPYIAGHGDRTYRDGGDLHGARLSLDWALDGARRLARGGRFLLYTGSAIVAGRDGLREALADGLDPDRFRLDYEELDPDVFGEQLAQAPYRDVERIAAVGASITRLA